MENEKIYWFITVMHCADYYNHKFHTGPIRCWGFYSDLNDALYAIQTNMTDMWETVYYYAVLEPYYEGISGYCFEKPAKWFKYNKNTNCYELIDEPEGASRYIGFALG